MHADTLWSNRLFRLKQATGWTNAQLAEHGGMGTVTVSRVFQGRRPNMPVVFKIKALEVRCAADLKAFNEGRIVFDQYGKRIDFRDDLRARPSDLKDLGQAMGVENGRIQESSGVARVDRVSVARR